MNFSFDEVYDYSLILNHFKLVLRTLCLKRCTNRVFLFTVKTKKRLHKPVKDSISNTRQSAPRFKNTKYRLVSETGKGDWKDESVNKRWKTVNHHSCATRSWRYIFVRIDVIYMTYMTEEMDVEFPIFSIGGHKYTDQQYYLHFSYREG